MPMMYKQRVYSRRYDRHNTYMFRDPKYEQYQFNPRNLMIEFLQFPEVEWFLEQGIALSVETFEVAETMEMQADLIAHFTGDQYDAWREQKIIDKLQNSYNTNTSKKDYPF